MPAQLYYTPTSCGGASFISAFKGGLIQNGKVIAHKVDIQKHVITEDGSDFFKVNPKGNVPALVLEDGTLLNEGAATLQWIADHANEGSHLAPANGTSGRYVLQNTLNYLASEVHASYGPLFGPGSDEFKAAQKAKLATKFKYVDEQLLGSKPYLLGAEFTVADAYLFVMTGWAGYVGFDLAPYCILFSETPAKYTNVGAFIERAKALDFVVAAQAAMAEAK